MIEAYNKAWKYFHLSWKERRYNEWKERTFLLFPLFFFTVKRWLRLYTIERGREFDGFLVNLYPFIENSIDHPIGVILWIIIMNNKHRR